MNRCTICQAEIIEGTRCTDCGGDPSREIPEDLPDFGDPSDDVPVRDQ